MRSLGIGALLALVLHCGPKKVDDVVQETAQGSLRGRVYSTLGMGPIAGATIKVGSSETTTGADGSFTLAAAVGERRVVEAIALGHALGLKPVRVLADQESFVEIFLTPVSVQAMVDAGAGGQVGMAGGASATVPAGGLVDKNGQTVNGGVQVTLAAVNPTQPDAMRAFPGDFTATTKDGRSGILETFVPMDISVTQDGADLDLAPGQEMVVTFPVYDPAHAPQTIALWSLDEESGSWVEEGSASLFDDNGSLVYRGTVTHLSWWNCDAFVDQVTCIRGCVTLDGEPVRGAYMRARGVDYQNAGGGWTNSDGCFAEDVKAGGTVELTASNIDGASAPRVISAGTTLMRAANDPSKCQDVGELPLLRPDPGQMPPGGCPMGFSPCDGQCVDLMSSAVHCGSCNAPCRGGSGGPSCIAGVCGCPGSQALCNNSCVDTQSDSSHCGGCDPCPIGQTCQSGACVAIVCDPSLTLCGNDCADLNTSVAHCGACGKPCFGDSALYCDQGQCACSGGLDMCLLGNGEGDVSRICADFQTEEGFCGNCDTHCITGEECVTGVCEPITCEAATPTLCGNDCADLTSATNHCGECFRQCYDLYGEQGANASCENSQCACQAPTTNCSMLGDPQALECRDLTSDLQSCGACGVRCISGETCAASDCAPIVCGGGETLCGSECVNTTSDPRHCGACGQFCPSGIACIAGTCDCASGTACRDAAADLGLTCDSGQCAAPPAVSCGDISGYWSIAPCDYTVGVKLVQIDCAFGSDFVVGELTGADTITIADGFSICTGTITGDMIDGTCNSGACTLWGMRVTVDPGYGLCSNNYIDLQTDPFSCGFCGNACGPNAVCDAGVCQALGRQVGAPCYGQYPYCDPGLICDPDTFDQCIACGGAGEYPCLQLACGEPGEPCCTGDTLPCIQGTCTEEICALPPPP